MQTGIPLIKRFEGCRLAAYICPAGVLTIGYGHTGADVRRGQVISQVQADTLLARDYARFEIAVRRLVHVAVTDNQLGALVSFAFNVGTGNLQKSTLLRMLNAGDRLGAANQFKRWNRAGGRVLEGLTTRRAAERSLFLLA